MQGDPGERESFLRDVSGETQSTLARRLIPLDVLRGMAVVLMILVTDGASMFNHKLDSAEWDGLGVADAVPAIFLFVLGFSMSLSFARFWEVAKRQHDKPRTFLATRSCARGLGFFIIGIVLEGTGSQTLTDVSRSHFIFDLATLRIPGVLQRIGFVHIAVSLSALLPERTSSIRGDTVLAHVSSFSIHRDIILRRFQSWICAFIVLVIYVCVLFAYDVPKCGRAHTTPECNAAREIDLKILGVSHILQNPPYTRSHTCNPSDSSPIPEHCLRPFDPWGVLPSLPAIVASFIGYHYGECWVSARLYSNTDPDLLPQKLWLHPVLPLTALSVILHFSGHHINRGLYSLSYLFASSAACGLAFVCIHFLHSRFRIFQKLFYPFMCVGQNAFVVYVFGSCAVLESMMTCVYWKSRHENNLVYLFRQSWLIDSLGDDWGTFAFVLTKIFFWMFLTWLLRRQEFFFKF